MKEATKHTPGPWEIVPYGNGDSLVICTALNGNWRICFMATPGGSPGAMEKIEADAHLIASAPDLAETLAALIEADDSRETFGLFGLADCIDNDGVPYQSAHLHGIISRARSALARARGETP
jgi:hypothetical protein